VWAENFSLAGGIFYRNVAYRYIFPGYRLPEEDTYHTLMMESFVEAVLPSLVGLLPVRIFLRAAAALQDQKIVLSRSTGQTVSKYRDSIGILRIHNICMCALEMSIYTLFRVYTFSEDNYLYI
jgi:hypothetical protein